MSLFKNYFNKEQITKITHEDLVTYFSEPKEENDKIEYKSSIDKELKKCLNSICGFLNSEGGILILGAPVGKKIEGKKEKIFSGELSFLDIAFEKDAFISKVTDNITPAPKGIMFHKIEMVNKYVYVLEIPKSEYSPHQYQNIYYMRIDGQTRPAPHHYVEALFKKIRFPNLEGYIRIDKLENIKDGKYHLSLSIFIYNLTKLQNDYNVSYRLICSNGKFVGSEFFHAQDSKVKYISVGERLVKDFKEIIHYGEVVTDSVTIEFDTKILHGDNYITELLLTFGAKYSPMKTCSYKLEIGGRPYSNPQECIIEIEENQLLSEARDKIGISEKEAIETLIGRKIRHSNV